MADSNTHINYSVEDIGRYLQGKMSAKEMHDMEKAALQDPFLADAIEGYSNATFSESHKHLNEITAALQPQKEATKIVPLPLKNFYWWKIAAMIILVVGVGVLSWYIINSNNSADKMKELANAKENKTVNADSVKQLKEQSASTFGGTDTVNSTSKTDTISSTLLAQNKPESPAAIKKEYKNLERAKTVQPKLNNELEKKDAVEKQKIDDSFLMTTQDTVSFNFSTQRKKEALEKIPSMAPVLSDSTSLSERIAHTKVAPSNVIVLNDSAKLAGKSAGIAVAPSREKKYFYSNNNALMNNFSGRVTDNNNQPVPYATVSANNYQTVTTDAKGNFRLQAPDSLLKVTVSSVGFVPETTQLKSTTANFISIEQDKNVLNDVVVTGYGIKKKQKLTDTISVYPAGGWESFQAYVYKKLKKPVDTTSAAQIMGNVQLQFSIDANGDPYNFSVLKSANEESASKAIEIIKDGPKWITTGRNKKGKVTIQF